MEKFTQDAGASGVTSDRFDLEAPVTLADLNSLVHTLLQERAADQLRMQVMEAELRQNTAITAEVREILAVGRSGLRALGALGTAAQWLGKISAAAVAIYAAIQLIRHGGKS